MQAPGYGGGGGGGFPGWGAPPSGGAAPSSYHGGGGGGSGSGSGGQPSWMITVKVHGGRNLPKADTFGKIDAYVRLGFDKASGGVHWDKTSVKKSDFNPNWKETLCYGEAYRTVINVQVWDSDSVGKDDMVATGLIQLSNQHLPVKHLQVPLTLEKGFKKKKGGEPYIIVSIAAILSYTSLKARLSKVASFYSDDSKQMLYFPVTAFNNATGVVCGLQYEKDKRVDIHLLETHNNQGKFISMALAPPFKHYRIRRRTSATPFVAANYQVYAETKLDDIKAFHNFGAISFLCSDVENVSDVPMSDVTSKHGWKGSLSYDQAKRTLNNVECIDSSQTIWFKSDHAALENDWDSSNADLGYWTYEDSQRNAIITDITHASTKKRTYTFYGQPKVVGNLKLTMKAAVDDLPYPVRHNEVNLVVNKMKNTEVVPFLSLFPIYG
ncbi:Elastin [Balamuthia mandrillaris]